MLVVALSVAVAGFLLAVVVMLMERGPGSRLMTAAFALMIAGALLVIVQMPQVRALFEMRVG